MSQRWQAGATYTLSGLWNEDPLPLSGMQQVTFPVTPDLGGEYTLAETDQRHRTVRASQRIALGGRARIEGIAEVFNLFNHENYGTYTTQESSPSYGQPTHSANLGCQSRRAQFGFRTTF